VRNSVGSPPSIRFDWFVLATCLWFIAGLLVDGWAHSHLDLSREGFFTPFHAMFYSGFAAVGAVVFGTILRRRSAGMSWREAIPPGYEGTVAGIALFVVGGVLDMSWHLAFGIEQDLAALLSPTHQLLAISIGLILCGPIRASLRRGDEPTPLVALLALTLVTILIEFFLMWTLNAHAGSGEAPLRRFPELSSQALERMHTFQLSHGILSILIRSVITTGVFLYAVRRLSLRLGAMTIIYGMRAALLTLMRTPDATSLFVQLTSALAAGLIADILIVRYQQSGKPTRLLRAIAAAVPAAWWTVYIALIGLTQNGWWWEVHVISGVVVFGAVSGLLLSYVAEPSDQH
jgi:hypothetical protein